MIYYDAVKTIAAVTLSRSLCLVCVPPILLIFSPSRAVHCIDGREGKEEDGESKRESGIESSSPPREESRRGERLGTRAEGRGPAAPVL